ncbi:MAG: iron-sulfur cluster assembly scaffold protein [Nanoarchaeota archaeon]
MKKITKKMTFGKILDENPDLKDTFAEKGLGCFECPFSKAETLEEGAFAHGLEPDELVKELNKKLSNKKNNSISENAEYSKNLMKNSGYSDKAIDYYEKKLNVGVAKNVSVQVVHIGACGDSMQFSLSIQNGVIKDAKFQAIGCAGAYVSGSALTVLAKGKRINEVKKLNEQDVLNHLEKIPKQKIHCVNLALKTLMKAIQEYEENLS